MMGAEALCRFLARHTEWSAEDWEDAYLHLFHTGWLDDKDDPGLRAAMEDVGIALVHVPKTAGNSVAEQLYGRSPSHRTWRWYKTMSAPTVAVIREPISRFLSAYDFLRSGGLRPNDQIVSRLFVSNDVNKCVKRLTRSDFLSSYYHFRDQSYFVAENSTIMVDELVAFENLTRRFPKMGQKNVTEGRRTTRTELSEESLDALAKHYAMDFALHRIAHEENPPFQGIIVEQSNDP